MSNIFDLTTEEGLINTSRYLTTCSYLGPALYPALFILAKLVSILRPAEAVEEQAQAAIDLIKVGKENGVKKMTITLSEQAGVNLDLSSLDGVKMSMNIGTKGKTTVDVEYH
jgi:hypothetical protein